MKLLESTSLFTVIVSVLCIKTLTAKRFDKDNPINLLAEIQEIGIDLGVPIEVNQKLEDIDYHMPKGQGKPKPPPSKPSKPKPEFSLSSFSLLPILPESLQLSSSWAVGSSMGPSLIPSFSSVVNSPYSTSPEQPLEESSVSSEPTILVPPTQYSQGYGRPPRPPPVSQQTDLETEMFAVKPPPSSSVSSQSRPPPQSQPPPPQSQPTTVIYLEPNVIPAPVFSQSQQSWNNQPQSMPVAYPQSQPPPAQWSSWSQTPQYQPVQWSQQPQQSTWTLQPSPSVSSSQSQPPPSSNQQSTWTPYQSANPSAPFSMYQQLNLHLLEAWEKMQDQNEEEHQQNSPPIDPIAPLPPPALLASPYLSTTLNTPNMIIIPNISIVMNNTLDESNNEILDSVEVDVADSDYMPHPGYLSSPQYTNADITIDDDKFLDDDDDFVEGPDRRKQKQQKQDKGEQDKVGNQEEQEKVDKKGEQEEVSHNEDGDNKGQQQYHEDKDEIMQMVE